MKVVKNNVVSMEWDADGFIETKKLGFVSAIHVYNGIPLAFRDGKIYTHIDEDGVISFKDFVSTIKSAIKSDDNDYPTFYEDYVEIYDGAEFEEEFLKDNNIPKEDLVARLEDLGGYWVEIITDTPTV